MSNRSLLMLNMSLNPHDDDWVRHQWREAAALFFGFGSSSLEESLLQPKGQKHQNDDDHYGGENDNHDDVE